MPYNSETETFYQAPATVVDSTPDGDTVQEGFDDRLTPALAGVYSDINLLKADGMISVGIPATTTARGIGRVATSDDLVDGTTIANGPAFLSAGGGVVTPTPTANAVPQADGEGKLDNAWMPGKANTDLSDLAPAAGEVIRQNTTMMPLGTRTTQGEWTLTGVKPGRALILGMKATANVNTAWVFFRVVSGSDIGQALYSTPGSNGAFALGRTGSYITSCSATLKPNNNTVVIGIDSISNAILYAEQI